MTHDILLPRRPYLPVPPLLSKLPTAFPPYTAKLQLFFRKKYKFHPCQGCILGIFRARLAETLLFIYLFIYASTPLDRNFQHAIYLIFSMVRRSKNLSTVMVTESKTKMIGLIDAFINPYIYHCCKRCERKRQKKVHFPTEISFDILLHLPAHVLHDVMRHVCREWSLVLQTRNFIYDHLRKTTGGLIIQNRFMVDVAIYVEMQQDCLKISKFESGSKNVVWISCNGLVLTFHGRERHILYVTNPVTKQWLILPPCIHAVRLRLDCVLAFVEASMEYKVVLMHGLTTSEKQIILLTVGVDKVWRHLDTEHFSLTTRRALEFDPIVTGGFIHWITHDFVLTFNVETETFRHSLVPPFVRTMHIFLPMGSDLSFISATREFLWDVWEMNSQTGEWAMLLSIDLEAQRCQLADLFCEHEDAISEIIPAGWLVLREVLVFSVDRHPRLSIVCNVKTGEIQSFELEGTRCPPIYRPHVNSFVWLDGDSLREMEDYRFLTHCPPILQRRQ